MKGWKSFVFGAATVLLGLLQGTEVTNIVAQYPGAITSIVGVIIIALRFVTTSPIFKA